MPGVNHQILLARATGGNDSFTKLLLHCDGADASTTFTDSSSAAHTVTANGNAQVDTAQSKFGGASALFDGTGDYLSSASHADWNFGGAGSGDFTVDLWVRFNALGADRGFFSTNDAGTAGYQFYWATSGTTLRVWSGAGTDRSFGSWSPSTGTWYHVAFVRSGGTLTAYVDGTSIGTATDGDFNNDSTAMIVGAGNNAGSAQPMNGWIDEFRVSKGIARWTSNFTPPTSAYS